MATFNRIQDRYKFPEKLSCIFQKTRFFGFCIFIFGSMNWKTPGGRFFSTTQTCKLKSQAFLDLQSLKSQCIYLQIHNNGENQ